MEFLMANRYTFQLPFPEDGEDTFIQTIIVGGRSLQFKFQWATSSDEQFSYIKRFLDTKSRGDPLILGNVIINDYNYVEYYYGIILWLNEDPSRSIEEWLSLEQALPRSISIAPLESQLIMLRQRIEECASLLPIIAQYNEVLRWQFRLIYGTEKTIGVVEPGGWYRNQDSEFSFRFLSDRTHIGKEDIGLVTIEFEVYSD